MLVLTKIICCCLGTRAFAFVEGELAFMNSRKKGSDPALLELSNTP